jgi:hypothetical protein
MRYMRSPCCLCLSVCLSVYPSLIFESYKAYGIALLSLSPPSSLANTLCVFFMLRVSCQRDVGD